MVKECGAGPLGHKDHRSSQLKESEPTIGGGAGGGSDYFYNISAKQNVTGLEIFASQQSKR